MDNYRRLKKIADTKILKETEWISLIDRDGYIYSHESRCYKNATVALLPYRMHNNKLEFLIRYEYCPAHYINKKMEELSSIYQMPFPKGASLTVDEFAASFIKKYSKEELYKVCKTNFVNYKKNVS